MPLMLQADIHNDSNMHRRHWRSRQLCQSSHDICGIPSRFAASAKLSLSQNYNHTGAAQDSVLAQESLTHWILLQWLAMLEDEAPAPICTRACHLIQGALPCCHRVVSVCLDGVVGVCAQVSSSGVQFERCDGPMAACARAGLAARP